MKRILPTIVISQFLCTSVWFAGSAVIGEIAKELHLGAAYLGYLASAVQFGFITGTLLFAVFGIADRYKPTAVFGTCALLAAAANLLVILSGVSIAQILLLRFATGFFLAGIYPVGMKIAADHYQHGLGRSLGFLVGALVIGTAFPHLLKSLQGNIQWRFVIITTSLLAVIGGLAMYLIVPAAARGAEVKKFKAFNFLSSFRSRHFRAFAFGYFGHMWELYAFWLFVPAMISNFNIHHSAASLNVPVCSFTIIAAGSLSCIASGWLSQYYGPEKIASVALALSMCCCFASPWLLTCNSTLAFISFLLVWSMAVIADSPLFSTLVAQHARPEFKGTSLTIVNCLGYSVTILSIQLINTLIVHVNMKFIYILLGAGPLFGLLALAGRRVAANGEV